MDQLEIVRLTVDSPHLARVAAWQNAEWGHLTPGETPTSRLKALRGECGDAGVPSAFAALCDGQPVGTASLVADDMSVRRELSPWLASVFVPPEWRGRGIASRLVQRVEAEVAASGIARLYLFTPDQQALYRRLGWQDHEALNYRGEDVTIMVRRLDAE
ncbi:GNAT family N-acetyltransferase [Halomonas heilongjiangensis]|uniref:GNAT family N-acetyltransferase n=1 Tax=Halomonas heilongjiangensis TaxID=1387883 RepID=A0A2N7TJM9_9GAMM|nr:GNAT family N-acetyltransferase [Halomonas heilongjiangensis]PMR68401.1 GNAT family N-acetyltransferase [Halomonas heilongjiangensis]PXX87176.1 GNAT family N-acetyltransferase [Halomonas heilongjiangensis]